MRWIVVRRVPDGGGLWTRYDSIAKDDAMNTAPNRSHLVPVSGPVSGPAPGPRTALLGLGLALALGSTGCSELCELSGGLCASAPCEGTTLSEQWEREPLSVLVPAEDVTVCEATVAEDGSTAKARFWVPITVHDANMDAVGSAQDHGWVRIGDNWHGTEGNFNTPKWSEFGTITGELLRVDVREVNGGAQVDVAYKGFPPLPELRGDVTLFEFKNKIVAMTDSKAVALLGIPIGGGVDPVADGFYYASEGRTNVLRYGPNGGVHPHPIVIEGSGQLGKHGVGPDGGLWITYDPYDDGQATQLGHLIEGEWRMEDLPPFDPPLTGHIQLAHGTDGVVFLVGKRSVHARKDGVWSSAALPHDASLDGVESRSDGSVIVATGKQILSVRLGPDGLELGPLGKTTLLSKVFGGGDTVVVRDRRKTVLVEGEQLTRLEGMHDRSGDGGVAVGGDGTIAVTHPKKDVLTVRTPDGTVTRYPQEGSLPTPISRRVWVDGTGRVYVPSKDTVFVVVDGSMKVLPKIGAFKADVFRIDFMGKGAAPIGLVDL